MRTQIIINGTAHILDLLTGEITGSRLWLLTPDEHRVMKRQKGLGGATTL